ncbi:MAG: hypothetical protein LAN84_04010 [Acidobacteriia bacterium]|nr:hypothetical protein [Terriglobia bacterium]
MTPRRKRAVLLVALLAASFAAACNGGSGSGTIFVPPPPAGNFTNASLKGQYAFSMTGRELCGSTGSLFARVGSITADGNGHITGGVEDVNVCSGVLTLPFTGGSYSIQADGRGTLSLSNSTGVTSYSIALASPAQGFLIQTDSAATASGALQLQNPAAFSVTQIAGGYVFDFSGISSALNPQSIIGRFTADGAGGVQNGLYDSNEAGTLSGQQLFPAGAFYQLDPSYAQSGRGTANFAGHNFTFYIVDGTRVKCMGTDFPAAYVGDAQAQQNMTFSATSLNGSFAFLMGGSSTSGPLATAGRFTADGGGNLTSVVLDENNNGLRTSLPTSGGTVTGSYTVDANGLGGGTATWTDSSAGTFSFIFYLLSPAQAVFQETDSQITSDGSFLGQTSSPITSAALAGNYAFVWSGVRSDEEDFTGQLKLTSASGSNASGTLDANEFATGKQFFNFPIAGTLALGSNPAGRNTFTVTTNAPPNPPATFNFAAYVVDANTVFLVGVDGNRVIVGANARQP